MKTDFLCEKKLRELNPAYHELLSNTAFVMFNSLDKYKTYFPTYTDHSVTHSLQVINFCNALIDEQIDKLNADEIYVLLMACYLHDIGMGIPMNLFSKLKGVSIPDCNDDNIPDTIRNYHHVISYDLIHKWSILFEIPSREHVEAIALVAMGHRKVNLYEPRYSDEFKVPNGNIIRLPYLSALIRLADELDIAADRNISFIYKTEDNLAFRKHKSIKKLRIEPDRFVLEVSMKDTIAHDTIVSEIEKLQKTLNECLNVVDDITPFVIHQKKVIIETVE